MPEHGPLHRAALEAWRSGDTAKAEALFRKGLTERTRQPDLLVDFAEFLRTQGRLAEAEAALRNAVRAQPKFVAGWYRLAFLLHGDGRCDQAARCARRVTALAPGDPRGWELAAAIEQKRGALGTAISVCEEGLRHLPTAARLHYSLGQLLREDCRFVEAAAAYQAAQQQGSDTPDLYRNWAEALIEAGDTDGALARFDAGVARFPAHALLQRQRARFLWEFAVPGDSLAVLRDAARALPAESALWETLVDLMRRQERADEAQSALAEARAACGGTPILELHEAALCAVAGERRHATRLYARLENQYPDRPEVLLPFAAHLLSTGDPERAEAICARVLAADQRVQLAWAYRGTAWQMLGDPRAGWLLDYDTMVMAVSIPPPPGYSTTEQYFDEAVRPSLEALHRAHAHPIDQSVRGGTQTNGFLFRYQDPVLRQLESPIRSAVREALANAPRPPDHPFWGRCPGVVAADAFSFSGAWSVRLATQGFHTNHIHPEGWMSSALYVALPDEVLKGQGPEGSIQFGVPLLELEPALPPGRIVKPQVGKLLLFPSYMWHGTIPFTSNEARVTVAFDLQPKA